MNMLNDVSNFTTAFEPGCKVICGAHAASAYLLSICAEIAVRRPLRLLDFGNRCDMYFAARRLRLLTRDPVSAMRNILLQRAFTCYQAAALLRRIEGPEPDMPVIILDLLAPFLDENIPARDIDRLFNESLEQIRTVGRSHFLLIGVKPVPQRIIPARVGLMKRLESDLGMVRLPEPETAKLPVPDPEQPRLF